MRSIELIIGDWVLYTSTALAIIFVLAYIFLSKDGWRKTPVGRGIFFLIFSIGFVCVTIALANWIGPSYWGRPIFRIGSFACLPLSIGNMLRLLIALQNENYRTRYPRKYNLPR